MCYCCHPACHMLLLSPSLSWVTVVITQPVIDYCCHPACHRLLLSSSLSWVAVVTQPVIGYCCHQPVMGYCSGHPACHRLLLSPSLSWVTAVTQPVMGYCRHPACHGLLWWPHNDSVKFLLLGNSDGLMEGRKGELRTKQGVVGILTGRPTYKIDSFLEVTGLVTMET